MFCLEIFANGFVYEKYCPMSKLNGRNLTWQINEACGNNFFNYFFSLKVLKNLNESLGCNIFYIRCCTLAFYHSNCSDLQASMLISHFLTFRQLRRNIPVLLPQSKSLVVRHHIKPNMLHRSPWLMNASVQYSFRI